MNVLTLVSEADTRRFGYALGQAARPGDALALYGDLGAGKTTLTQAIAAGLGVDAAEAITSPTYALINEHRSGRIPLYHMDAYRIVDSSELGPIGYEDYAASEDGLLVIEWAGNIESDLPEIRLSVSIAPSDSDNERIVHAAAFGSRAEILLHDTLAYYRQMPQNLSRV